MAGLFAPRRSAAETETPSLNLSDAQKAEFIGSVSKKYGVSGEVVRSYCDAYSIWTEQSLLSRMEKNNYGAFAKGGVLQGREASLESLAKQKGGEGRFLYATEFEGAMLAELACHKAGKDDLIPKALKILADKENLRIIDPATGKRAKLKLTPLMVLGLSYDGVDALDSQAPEMLTSAQKSKYLEDSTNALSKALIDSSGNIRTKDAMIEHIAIVSASMGYGYTAILNSYFNQTTYAGTEVAHSYDSALNEFETNKLALINLASSGVIEKADAKKYTADTLYARTYSTMYSIYSSLGKSAKTQGEKDFLEKLGVSTEEEVATRSGQLSSTSFLLSLEQKYFNLLKPADQRAFNLFKSTYEQRVAEIMTSDQMSFSDKTAFLMGLFKYSSVGEKALKEWSKTNKDGDYFAYLAAKTGQVWAEKAVGSQLVLAGLENTAENKDKYVSLVFQKGFSQKDIKVAIEMGSSLDALLETYARIEQNSAYKQLISDKTGKKGIDLSEDYQNLVAKTLLPRLVLRQLAEKSDKLSIKSLESLEASDFAVIGSVDSAKIKADVKSLMKSDDIKDQLPKLSDDKKQMLELNQLTMLFIKRCTEGLPIGYSRTTTRQEMVEQTGAAFVAKPAEYETKRTEALVKPSSQGYFIVDAKSQEYSPDAFSYYGASAWCVKRELKKPENLGAAYAGTMDFMLKGTEEGTPEREEAEKRRAHTLHVYNARFKAGYDFFMANEDKIKSLLGFEYDRLAEAAQMTLDGVKAKGVAIKDEEAYKKGLMAAFWGIQVSEYTFELFAPGRARFSGDKANSNEAMQVWYAGYSKAKTEGLPVADLEAFKAAVSGALPSFGLKKNATYDLAIISSDGTRKSLMDVATDAKGAAKLSVAQKEQFNVKMGDRLLLMDGDSIVACSNGANAPLLLNASSKRLNALWREHFVKNGTVELGLAQVTMSAGEVMVPLYERVEKPAQKMDLAPTFRTVTTTESVPYVRDELLNLYPAAIRGMPFLPYNALTLPPAVFFPGEANLKIALPSGLGNGELAADLIKGMLQVVIDPKTGDPTILFDSVTQQQIINKLMQNGFSQNDAENIFNYTFEVKNGKIVGFKDGVTFSTTKLRDLVQKAAADVLKERRAVTVGVIYRFETPIFGMPVSLMPTLNVPTGKGEVVPSVTANIEMFKLASKEAKASLTGTVGLGSEYKPKTGVYPVIALTAGLDFSRVSPRLTAGYAQGMFYGGGATFYLPRSKLNVDYVDSGFLGVATLSWETRKGTYGVSALRLGSAAIIPIPFVFADVTKVVNKALVGMGIMDRTIQSTPVPIGKLGDLYITPVKDK